MMSAEASTESFDNVDVLIVANFASIDGSRNGRFSDLAHRLKTLGAEVELVTSDFSHRTHSPRRDGGIQESHQVTLVHETGYPKNISIKRLISQHSFGRSVAKYLHSRQEVPDLIYCATPPPGVARACAEFARQRNIAFVVDIQDLWPEAFGMSVRMPSLIRMLFSRMRRSSRIAYRLADLIVGVSRTYLEHAQTEIKTRQDTSVVFLGTSLAAIDHGPVAEQSDSETGLPKIIYAGTLSHSYDLPMVMEAMAELSSSERRFAELELVVAGDGPKRMEFEQYAARSGVNARFLGRLPYQDMLSELRAADIAVNPIVAGSMGSVLNKVGDYAGAGLPVINTQESPEYRDLLDTYRAGLNCSTGSASEVASAIRELTDHPEHRSAMGRNNRRMAEELFDRDRTYQRLAEGLVEIAQTGPRATSAHHPCN